MLGVKGCSKGFWPIEDLTCFQILTLVPQLDVACVAFFFVFVGMELKDSSLVSRATSFAILGLVACRHYTDGNLTSSLCRDETLHSMFSVLR